MKFHNIRVGMFFVILFAVCINVSNAAPNVSKDGEIIAYMEALNNAEIQAAKLAQGKKIDTNVMNFANTMIEQHGDNLKKVTDLSSSTGIAEDQTSGVKKFIQKNDNDYTSLSKLDGKKFQINYINAMIKGHTDALKMINHFISESQNADLKNYLTDTKSAVEDHLAAAKKLK